MRIRLFAGCCLFVATCFTSIEAGENRPQDPLLTLNGVSIVVDGARVVNNLGDSAGRFVVVATPSTGELWITTRPQPGYRFHRAGTVEGKRLSFTFNRSAITLESTVPILEGGGREDVWVLH